MKLRCVKAMKYKTIAISTVALLVLTLIIVTLLSNTSLNTPNEGSCSFDSLIYPSNTTTIEPTDCRVLIDETKPKPRINTQTVVVIALTNGTIKKTTTTSNRINTVSEVHEGMDRLLPIVEYTCNSELLVIVFTKLRHVNVSKILLTIKEYTAPVSGNDIKHFSEEGDKMYVELVNGSRKLMKETLKYMVNVEQGGYIVLEKDNRSITKLLMTLNYFDGFIKQYGIEIVRVRIKQICLDSNCTLTFTP